MSGTHLVNVTRGVHEKCEKRLQFTQEAFTKLFEQEGDKIIASFSRQFAEDSVDRRDDWHLNQLDQPGTPIDIYVASPD